MAKPEKKGGPMGLMDETVKLMDSLKRGLPFLILFSLLLSLIVVVAIAITVKVVVVKVVVVAVVVVGLINSLINEYDRGHTVAI